MADLKKTHYLKLQGMINWFRTIIAPLVLHNEATVLASN